MSFSFSRIKTWVNGEVLTHTDLNAEFNNIINNASPATLSSTGASASNMQEQSDPGELGSEIVTSNLREDIRQLRKIIAETSGKTYWYQSPSRNLGTGALSVQTDDLATSSVTTVKIANDAVTADKLADDASVDANRAVTENHIRDTSITTAKIANQAVTAQKIAQHVYTNGVSSGNFSTTSTSMVPVTNLSVSITASGNRPVLITLESGTTLETSDAAYIFATTSGIIQLKKNGNPAQSYWVESINMGAIMFLDTSPSAGSNTYSISTKVTSGTMFINRVLMVACEL